MINRVDDLLGPLMMFWRLEWEAPEETTLFHNTALREQDGIWDERVLESIPEDYKYFRDTKRRWPLFMLDPRYFKRLTTVGWSSVTITMQPVLRRILPMIQLRRTMVSEYAIGGKSLRVGRQIPGFEVCLTAISVKHPLTVLLTRSLPSTSR